MVGYRHTTQEYSAVTSISTMRVEYLFCYLLGCVFMYSFRVGNVARSTLYYLWDMV